MPHLSLTYTRGVSSNTPSLLTEMHNAFLDFGFAEESIKCYGIIISHCHIAGHMDSDMAHLNFKLLQKSDRTADVVNKWLEKLYAIMNNTLSTDCSVTAEAVFLQPFYISKTA